MDRYPFRFRASVAATANATWSSRQLNADGLLRRLVCHFPPGSEGTLSVFAWIVDSRGSRRTIVFNDADGDTDEYLSGDDVMFDFNLRVPLQKHDLVRVLVENNDEVNAHVVDISFEVEEEASGGGR